MALKQYQAKRSFDSTPEPSAQKAKTDQSLRFVIQKHDASHLHYDFRLENKGVMVSWAIPKGPSLNPADKRLAMMTEDHPYDYQYFEGVIPKGNYGAGQVIIWDRGTFEIEQGKSKAEQEKEFRHMLHLGDIKFTIHGEKIKGKYALVKTKSAGKPDNSWLLIKKKDEAASTKDITKQDKSVVSGHLVDEVEDEPYFSWDEFRDCIDKFKLKKSKMPERPEPMLATLSDQPFDDPKWLFEVKWDGYRTLAANRKDKVQLWSRRGQNFNGKYPRVVDVLDGLAADALLDGEVVVLDEAGKPDFNALQNYDPKSDDNLVYYVFDLLWLDGYDLTKAPLSFRKSMLKKLLPRGNVVRYSDHIEKRGKDFFEAATDNDLEGIMAKRAESAYKFGYRSSSWLKFKTIKRQEAVIGGFTEPRGNRQGLGALILGVYEGKELRYIGHSGSGLGSRELTNLRKMLDKLERKTSPFKTEPKPNAPVHWVKPELLVEAAFSEWTASGHMRHPKIIGLRENKPAQRVGREQAVDADVAKQAGDIEFTHLEKVFWPKLKITKGDLVNYYQVMAERMMPYLADRPVSLLRQPNGIKGQAFFQKDMMSERPHGFRTFRRYSESNKKDVHYFVCDSPAALLYMVQLGCIEINPWNSTTQNPDKPDWLVLDLDPEDIGFKEVVRTALVIKDMLSELKITGFPKTSGKTGIHIYLPLHAKYDYDVTRQFAELLARNVVMQLPKITSVERSPSKRQGKIYVDFLQNRVGQTLAAPYSVRPTAEASVSMPLDWGEVTTNLKPSDFTLQNLPGILAGRSDPWAKFFDTQIDIEKVLKKLERK